LSAAPSQPLLQLEPFQRRAWSALVGPSPHVLLYGGARSGKTYLVLLWLVLRALAKPAATHAVLRYRFNHIKASIIDDTLPAVCATHWAGQKLYELNRTDWYAEFVSGGRIYFGGLDDKERTEKILGQGHSSIYLNEASQISFTSRLKAITRLSQSRGLVLKEVCDANPPDIGHWTERLWLKGVDPLTGKALPDRSRYAVASMNPAENPHIPESTKAILRALPPRERRRFWEGLYGQGIASPLWTYESIEKARIDRIPDGVTLTQVVIPVDPSGCHGPEDKRSDEVGIVPVGLGSDGVVYVLEDVSDRLGPGGPEGWGARSIQAYVRHSADAIVGEINFGGAMVGNVILTAKAVLADGRTLDGSNVPFREVTASRGKTVRAEPVGTLTDRGKLKFVGHFPELEEQLTKFSTAGYMGERSPDRADAMVWGAHALGVTRMPGQGLSDWTQQQAERLLTAAVPQIGVELVELVAPPHFAGTFFSRLGAVYQIEGGRVLAKPQDVDDLTSSGFVRSTT
jgi:phage terminase large subunit-like protein